MGVEKKNFETLNHMKQSKMSHEQGVQVQNRTLKRKQI